MKWSPPWCPWIEGEFEVDPKEFLINMTCSVCGDRTQTVCMQGRPRLQIARYGTLLHMHGRDKEKWSAQK